MNMDPLILQSSLFFLTMAPVLLLVALASLMIIPLRLPEHWIAFLVKTGVILPLISLAAIGLELILAGKPQITYAPFEMFTLGKFQFEISYFIDIKGISFTLLALSLAYTIAFFAQRYMHREPGYLRFFTLYSLFVAGMTMVTLAGTVETLFIGWEMVGLSSALLVAFFQERIMPTRNAFHLWLVYRVSDATLFLGMFFLHEAIGEVFFQTLLEQGRGAVGDEHKSATLFVAGLMIVVSVMAKSALIPFCGWLPRAMDGPTPSSAIFYGAISIHMGAFLLIRMAPLIELFPSLCWMIVLLGLATSVLSTIIEKAQCDMKSILAFSTLTQVGIIIAEIGMGWDTLAMIHIIGHAILRAYQFLHAPSSFQEYKSLQESLGSYSINQGSLQEIPLPFWNNQSLYRVGFFRGGMDAFMNDWLLQPFLGLCRLFQSLEEILFCSNYTGPSKAPFPPQGGSHG